MSDAHYMSHALSIGARGLGKTWPNPAVGCVLVADGRIVGRGWTQEAVSYTHLTLPTIYSV